MTTKASNSNVLEPVREALENSWVRKLSPELEENLQESRKLANLSPLDKNKLKRPVFNGHYVLVDPTGIREPRLVLYSKDVAQLLHLTEETIQSEEFTQWVSGNLVLGETWATPYALSIMGTRYYNNCPFGTGDGYGDGRAISIGEFHGYELQLKGAGTTPFHRGADGRAVLRSSIREFLASEAMHYLGVETTRALSLVVSNTETVQRPWYTEGARLQLPDMTDPRLQKYSDEEKRQILAQLRNQKADPNILVNEKAAITCRVATSFTRVGHIDLFARRVEKKSMQNADKTNKRYDVSTNEWKELEEIIWHACYREYREEAYDPFYEKNDIASAAAVLLERSAEAIATMVANWIRVGFVQGNFNADNCLVGGKTMDYGPFGWVEEYFPTYAKWTGSGEHFGFLNQPSAGLANYQVLVSSVAPVICAAQGKEDPEPIIEKYVMRAQELFQRKVDETFRIKLGFKDDMDAADALWASLEPILRESRVDWTLFFRQLTYVMRDFPETSLKDYDGMLNLLENSDSDREGASTFYEPLTTERRQKWLAWLKEWRTALVNSGAAETAYERMRTANPKFVLREWMLVDAYNGADRGEEAELFDLYKLIQRPYDEGTQSEISKYYRRASEEDLTKAGTAFFS